MTNVNQIKKCDLIYLAYISWKLVSINLEKNNNK